MVAGDSLNIDKLGQELDLLREVPKYKVAFVLSPNNLQKQINKVKGLSEWEAIKFNDPKSLTKVPDDKKGIYAFVVKGESDTLPLHGYVLYIGAAGVNSDFNDLRSRYKNYLSNSSVEGRVNILRIICDWYESLYFCFASVDSSVSQTELRKFEKDLNTALLPPFSLNDIDAKIKKARKAFP